MKVLFVIEAYFEWIGVRYLSALLKKEGDECDVLIESSIVKIARYVKKEQPNLVGYVTLSGLHKFCIASASEIKGVSPETKIIFGGPHATFFPKVIESDPVDYVCQGEGEIPFMELVHRMKSNGSTTDIPGIWAKQEGKIYQNPPKLLIDDLDTLPLPDDEIFEKYDVFRKSYSWASLHLILFQQYCVIISSPFCFFLVSACWFILGILFESIGCSFLDAHYFNFFSSL